MSSAPATIMLEPYKIQRVNEKLATKVLMAKKMHQAHVRQVSSHKMDRKESTHMIEQNNLWKINEKDAQMMDEAKRIGEIYRSLTLYVDGFNGVQRYINKQDKKLQMEPETFRQVRLATKPFAVGEVTFHLLGKKSGQVLNLPNLVNEIKVEKKNPADVPNECADSELSTSEDEDALTNMVFNMLKGMAKEGWAASKLHLQDAFRTEKPGVYLICGRLMRMKSDKSVYLDQGVVHVAAQGSDGKYGIKEVYFYDYDNASGSMPKKVADALINAGYFISPLYQFTSKL